MGRRNTFSRALKQLKSEEIDKKIQLIEALPTNNTMGVFSTAPDGYEVGTTTVQRDVVGEADLDFDADGESDGTDTTGLFESDGTPKAAMPPGDTSYILGPMSAMYYSWWSGGTTTIGYIKQSDRRMQNLGTISGKLHEWDGASFNSYGQLTLEQAVWFRDVKKKDDAGNDPANANYRAFYPGPPSNTPDANGRYLCTITGQPKDTTTTQNVVVPHSPTEKGEMSADDNFSALADRAMKHGLSKGRTDEMTEEELQKFVDMMDSLDADIEKYSAEEQAARKEMRNIAIGFGVDVALTLFGGAILKGVAKGASFGIKAIRNANKAKNIAKAADVAVDLNRARQQAQLNNLQKFAKTLKGSAKTEYIDDLADLKYFKQHQKNQSAVNKLYNKLNNPANYGQKGKLLNTLDDFGGTTTRTTTTTTQTSTQKTFKQLQQSKSSSSNITTTIPKNKVPKKGLDGKFRETDLNIKGPDGNVIAKNVKNSKTGQWERISKPGSNASRADIAKWERLEGQVSGKAWQNYVKTGELNPGILGDPLAAMNPFTKHGLRSGPTALAKKFGIPAGVGAGVGGAVIGNEIRKGVAGLSSSKQVQQFTSNVKSAIENVVSKASSPEQVTNSTIQLVSQGFPQEDRTAVRMFMQYLTGTAPENAGDLVPEADQEDAWKQMTFKDGGITVNGPMKNVFGGEPAENLTVDKDGNAVFKFNFAPRSNKEEFAGAPKGRWSSEYKDFLTKFEPLTQYMADLTPNFGKTKGDKAKGVLAGAATNVFKQIDKITPDGSKLVGGIKTARDLNGDIKIPMSKLKTLNPDAYNHLKSQQNTSSKWMPNKDVKTAYDPNKGTTVNLKHQFGAGGDRGATEVDLRHQGSEIYKYNRGEFQDPKNLDNIGDEIKTKLDNAIKNISKAKQNKSNIKTTTYGKALRVAHYEPQSELILESKASRVLKNLKNPVVIPDTKQKKYKVKPGARMRGMDTLVGDVKPQEPYKKPQKVWTRGKTSQNYNARESQEKKNQVLHYVGASMDHWDYMTETLRKQGAKLATNYKDHDYLYDYWLGGKKNKITRKEEVDGDFLVFMEDEDGKKTSILQSKLNAQVAQDKEKEAFAEYYKLNPKKEPIPYENDPLFKKVSKRLKSVIDYEGKPATKGYPNKPPPKQIDGWHPDFGKRYKYDKLDPVSAKAMPKTGNPEIDANVEKAARKPK